VVRVLWLRWPAGSACWLSSPRAGQLARRFSHLKGQIPARDEEPSFSDTIALREVLEWTPAETVEQGELSLAGNNLNCPGCPAVAGALKTASI